MEKDHTIEVLIYIIMFSVLTYITDWLKPLLKRWIKRLLRKNKLPTLEQKQESDTKSTQVDDDKAGDPEFEQYFIDESCKTCSSQRKGSKCHEFHECSSHSREYFKAGFNARKNS